MTEHTVFGIMPYLKTSGTVRVRGVSFYPSQHLNEHDKMNDDCKHHLQKLLPMFYLQHNTPIEKMLYTHLHVDSSEESRKALKRLREARMLIGYFYSSPHFPSGDPFLLHEYADFYLFELGSRSQSELRIAERRAGYVNVGRRGKKRESARKPPLLKLWAFLGSEGILFCVWRY